MSLKSDLTMARSLIATLDVWCQNYEALDAKGMPVSPRSPAAVRRDPIGACRALAHGEPDRDARVFAMERKLQFQCKVFYGVEVSSVNDGLTGAAPEACHTMMLAVFDKAIASIVEPGDVK